MIDTREWTYLADFVLYFITVSLAGIIYFVPIPPDKRGHE